MRRLWAYLAAAAIALAATFVFRWLGFDHYQHPSSTMLPTLLPGDVIIGQRWVYGVYWPGSGSALAPGRRPERGELATVRWEDGGLAVRRILAREGERVALQQGRVALGGEPLPFRRDAALGVECGWEKLPEGREIPVCPGAPSTEDIPSARVPDGFVWAVADHRALRADSSGERVAGLVRREHLESRPLWVAVNPREPSRRWRRIE